MHDYDGGRVSAALIDKDEVKTSISDLGIYPTWTGLSISGSVDLGFVDGTVSIGYNLQNVDPKCTNSGSAANSCGIHIHSV